MRRGCVTVDLWDRLFVIGDVDVVVSVPPCLKEPLRGCAEARAGMGSTLVKNTFIFSWFHVKLRGDAHQSVNIIFLETLTDIVREATPSESKTSSIEMFLLSTQTPRADSNALHVPVVKTRVHIANLGFCTTVNDANTEIDATLLVDTPGPIGDVLERSNQRHAILSIERSRHRNADL